jgi:hypothetical protein
MRKLAVLTFQTLDGVIQTLSFAEDTCLCGAFMSFWRPAQSAKL